MKKLSYVHKILLSKHHYLLELPYNLNWQNCVSDKIKEFLTDDPISICDVGARGGPPTEICEISDFVRYTGFDADSQECDRLNKIYSARKDWFVYPYFIGGKAEKLTFNLFTRPGESSVFPPDPRFKRLFGGNEFSIKNECLVQSTTLDQVVQIEKLSPFDLIKIDTQGSELDILKGGADILKNALLVEVEVEFVKQYAGQPLFGEIFEYMYKNGFELFYINRCFSQRKNIYSGPARGQVTFGDALFGRREDKLHGFSDARIVRYAILLMIYGYNDVAYNVLVDNKVPNEFAEHIIKELNKKTHGSLLKRGIFAQIDKILCILLHWRRYNQICYDSDRSWPFR
jgi:FkbM family methyltransferase